MNWEKAYIVLRANENGSFEVVHEAAKIKDARYWLNYIAQPNDALFRTSAHPKYAGDGAPEYQAHLIARGNVGYDQGAWESLVSAKAGELEIVAPAA